jgi:3',5'-cyclic AMP phosphodiesterase CpdA
MLIAQLSDFHLGADWIDADPAVTVAAAVAAVRALPQRCDAVIVTGDVAEHAAASEYEQALELLAPLEAPVHVLPGNHDDRSSMRRYFDLPGADADPIRYVVGLDEARVIVLDTTIPGSDAGALGTEQLAWLDAQLTGAPDTPTLLAMHHQPLRTGIPAWDAFGLAEEDRDALRAALGRHGQVRLIVGGHFHVAMSGQFAGRPVFGAPSAYAQARLAVEAERMGFTDEPIGFAVHALFDDDAASYVQAINR